VETPIINASNQKMPASGQRAPANIQKLAQQAEKKKRAKQAVQGRKKKR